MLVNYIKIAFRNTLKNRLFSFINISGMVVCIASCFLIGRYIFDELQFDQFNPDAGRTFRVYNVRTGDDAVVNYLPIVPYPFANYMQKDFPEIESKLRIMDTYGDKLFAIDNNKTMESNRKLSIAARCLDNPAKNLRND